MFHDCGDTIIGLQPPKRFCYNPEYFQTTPQGLDVMQQGLELLQGMSAVAPLSSIPENMLSSFVDLSRLDGPQIGVFQRLFEMMQVRASF